ncbi:YpmS family protein [Metabacillus arenae]|uniref:YpmS family protein n=1 Tax=Metabacillus arenae TaxID=2771434 RepID=A0A926NPK1_9BACI|nr:YpmS family protein [Metabacillus arenae]MBD1381591.1 YpmS family protein [Metabacillus arenae]
MNKIEKWKLAFVLLLSVNVLVIAAAGILVYFPSSSPQSFINHNNKGGETVDFSVSSSKESLNKLINHYLVKEANADELNYKILLDDKVYLLGQIQAFGNNIDVTLAFNPIVKEDGNMRLAVEELSLGRLQLPVPYVMKYIRDHYELPPFVHIDSNKQYVDVHLDEIQLKNKLRPKAESFDLENDNITFKLFFPLENL